MTPEKQFLDTQQVADYLGVHEKQVYTLVHDRGLPATKITGKWIFPRHLVDRWLEASVINMPDLQSFLQNAPDLLLIAGSDDPLLVRLLALFRTRHTETLVLQSRAGSRDGLTALKKGLVHLACVHLVDPEGGYTTRHIREYLGDDIAVVHFAGRQQGLILEPGKLESVGNLAGAFTMDFRWALRDVGTGTRVLMDMEMDRLGIDPGHVTSGAVSSLGHMDTALLIRFGQADAGFGIQSAAQLTGCDFLPVRMEQFDLIIRKENFFLTRIQELLALLREDDFTFLAESLTGYDLRDTGKIKNI